MSVTNACGCQVRPDSEEPPRGNGGKGKPAVVVGGLGEVTNLGAVDGRPLESVGLPSGFCGMSVLFDCFGTQRCLGVSDRELAVMTAKPVPREPNWADVGLVEAELFVNSATC